MYRGIIGLLNDDPEGELQSTRDRGAVEAEVIDTFDSGRLVTGEAVGSVERERDVPYVYDDFITTERETEYEKVYIEFLANLPDGWVTVDSSDGEFFWEHIEMEHGVQVGRAEVNVDAFAEDLQQWDHAEIWQAQAEWDDEDDADAGGVTIAYHDDAEIPDERIGQLGFKARWNNVFVRGIVTRSGYLALFNMEDEEAGQFITDVMLEYCRVPEEEQVELVEPPS